MPLTDHLLLLPRCSGRCKLRWDAPVLRGPCCEENHLLVLTSHSFLFQRCYYLLNDAIDESSAIWTCPMQHLWCPSVTPVKKQSITFVCCYRFVS